MYLLFDCNNFFASCEQVFRPDWKGRPLVVLSNNDGCVIARSAEAKAAGIGMGEPWFQCKERLRALNAVVCSSNFALYGDFSQRVMSILEDALPNLEQYSIDEAFAQVGAETHRNWEEEGRRLRQRIRRWTGITTSVGLAPSKTLAKLANETAKKSPQGILALRQESDWQPLLARTPVADIWGVGRKLAPRLQGLGIRTAAQLAESSLDFLSKHFGVHGERLALELQGTDCLGEELPSRRGQIMVSRSLKEGVRELATLRAVLCRFVEKAARNLRREDQLCREVHVILRTSRFESPTQQHAGQLSCTLLHPSDDTRELSQAATQLLERVWREGYDYKKIGVLLSQLKPREQIHPSFERPNVAPSPLMHMLDKLQQAGHDIHFANTAKEEPWQKSFTSPRYTTDWSQIPEIGK